MMENELSSRELSKIFELENWLQKESDHEKYEALGEVSSYLKNCNNHLIINTIFLKLAQIFKELPDILKIELKEVLKECVHKFAFSMNINEFLNIFTECLDSIDSHAKCQVIEIMEIFGPFCVDRHDIFHKIFDIFINTKMKYEKTVALRTLKSLHFTHKNFSRTLLKNMHSYLHNSENDDFFKRVVQLLPLKSEVFDMELLELYITILIKVLNELLTGIHRKNSELKKRKCIAITKIVLISVLESTRNFSIIRE